MVTIRHVSDDEVSLARTLHNRFTAQDKSLETIRSWYEEVQELFLFAVDEGSVIGVTTGRRWETGEASLAGIGLEPDRRGEGIGTRLVERFEAEARQAGIERLTVASAGGYVDRFYLDCGFHPERILVMDPADGPDGYADSDYDLTWDRNEDGSRKCYVDAPEYDPELLDDVRDAFGDDGAIYIMAKRVDGTE
jgi:N-acetylglutamate synthase-like GNAT family acetyltransferase